MRFCCSDTRFSFPDASPSFQCPYPASQLLPVFLQGIRSEYCDGVSSHERGSSHFSSVHGCLLLLILALAAVFFLPQQFLLSCAVAFLSLFLYHLSGIICAWLGSVSVLFRYLVLLFPALGHFGSSQRIPFSASFSFVTVVLLVFCLVCVSFSGVSHVALLPGFPVVVLL